MKQATMIPVSPFHRLFHIDDKDGIEIWIIGIIDAAAP